MAGHRLNLSVVRNGGVVCLAGLLLAACEAAGSAQTAHAAPASTGTPAAGEPVTPSFDCAKASSPLEKEICRDPQAARADRALAEAWRAALAATPEEFKPALTKGQRSFLTYADAACRTDGGYAEGCLARTYEEREGELAETVRNGFVSLVSYSVGAPAGGKHEPPVKIVKLRQIARPADAAERRWNAAVAERFERFQDAYPVQKDEWGTHVFSVSPVATAPGFIQTRFEYDDGSRYTSSSRLHWATSRDRELTAADLFEHPDAAFDALTKLATARATRSGAGFDDPAELTAAEVRAAVADLGNWSFDEDGVRLTLGEDPPIVFSAEVSWTEVKPLLRKDAAFDPAKLKSAL